MSDEGAQTHETLGRRRALTVLGAVALAPALGACGGEEEAAPDGCMDTTGLSPAEIRMRQDQHYVDATPNPEENCAGCRFYTANASQLCGSCQVVQGPIHPAGYCDLWAARG